MLLSKATYIAFKLQFFFYILSALAFPGNRTHDLGVASAMLYHLSYRKALQNACSIARRSAATYVRTLWRPTMKATFLLQGLIKDDQLVSRVKYSPLCARMRRGEWSNGCPANWRTDEGRMETTSMNSSAQIFTIESFLYSE